MNDMSLSGFASKLLNQDADLAFGFEAAGAPGAFVVREFTGDEAISECFSIEVDLASDDPAIDLHRLLDTPAHLSILDKYDAPRAFHGVIAEIEKRGTGSHRTFYRATLKPALHRLQYVSDSRIFQDLTVADISRTLLEEHGIPDVEWRLDGDHQPREYCVQYGETSYDFLRRIWAEEGIFFWFEHSVSSHKMIISDAPLAMPPLEHAGKITFNNTPGGTAKGSWVNIFDQVERLRATTRVSKDYSFRQPAYHQKHQVGQYEGNGAKGDYELFQFPGRHKTPATGQPFNDHALEAHRVDATTAQGETQNVHLCTGFIFELTDHPDAAANTVHRLLNVRHMGTQPVSLQEETPEDGATTYMAAFTTQPARIPYRANNPNPRPMVDGPQIAIVTGPADEEIYCDEFGRVKLWFPWDRHGQKNEQSSCWVRVSQNWAGGTWGHMAIPRIGHEVVVDFLEGDPDQPIITGRTYHATNRPPYDLPANKTRMTIKSQTHKGEGYNELRFEDEAGREEVWMHAQKDHNTVIENDESHQIIHDRSKSVGNDQSESVGHDKTISVGNDHTESVGHDARINVGNDVTYQVGQNQQDTFGKDYIQNVGNIYKQAIYADHLYEAGRNFEGQVNGTFKMDVGSSITTNTLKHTLMAGDTFEISGPGGKITIDASGITLEAAKIDLKGAVSMGGSGSAQVPTLSLAANEALPLCEECAKAAVEG